MTYLYEGLMPGEKIVFRTTLHWINIFWALFTLAVFTALFALAAIYANYSYAKAPNAEQTGGIIFAALILAFIALIAFFSLVGAAVSYATTEFGVTNERVLMKTGLLRRRSLEIVISQVEGVSVDQGLFGRILGYGNIVITGSGGTKQSFSTMSNPFEFRKSLMEQLKERAIPKKKKS